MAQPSPTGLPYLLSLGSEGAVAYLLISALSGVMHGALLYIFPYAATFCAFCPVMCRIMCLLKHCRPVWTENGAFFLCCAGSFELGCEEEGVVLETLDLEAV